MEKNRPWGETIEVPSAWKQSGRIALLRPYFYYHDTQYYPCDAMGFRTPTGFSNVKVKYEQSKALYKIFCLGGSTTFGSYYDYDSSYPAFLEEMTGAVVFNLGLQEMDLPSNVFTLIDALYQGLRPDLVICYDGANEKNGFKQAMGGRQQYRREHAQYQGFVDMNRAASLKHRLRMLFSRLKGSFREPPQTEIDPETIFRFAGQHARFYLDARVFLEELAERFGFKVVFFLQPSVWDYWGDGDAIRYRYIKAIYREILSTGQGIIDISSPSDLELDMFLDFFHLDPRGNEVIARTIFSHIDSCIPDRENAQ